MDNKEINYCGGDFSELWDRIGSHGVMTLSTCADSRVTSRPMSVGVIGGKFYCQTDESYPKCGQLRKNPNAALCFGNFSIKGKCRIIGRPCEHEFFIEAMKKIFRLSRGAPVITSHRMRDRAHPLADIFMGLRGLQAVHGIPGLRKFIIPKGVEII